MPGSQASRAPDPPRPAGAAHPGAQGRRTQIQRRTTSRASILAAARAEFIERGYREATLAGIVKRAGITRGGAYHLFDDKAAIFREIIEAESGAVRSRLAPVMASIDDPLERIRLGFSHYLDTIDDVRILKLIHVDYPDLVGPAKWTLESPWMRDTEALLTQASERGLLRPFPLRTMTRLILAFIREAIVAIAYAEDPAATRRDMAAALEVLIDGMRSRPA